MIVQEKISEDDLFQEIGGEDVILDLATSTYFGLDGIGARIWQLLQEQPDVRHVCEQLLQEYDVDAAQLEQDMQTLLQDLAAAGLVRLS